MSDSSQGSCRRCKAQVYWFKSFKTGKSYCCDTDDRRDFHKCDESAQPKAPTNPPAITPALPTRPTKREGNNHAKDFVGDSVEPDALPVDVLQGLIRRAIEQHIDKHQLEITKLAEQSERDVLMNWRTV